MWRRLPELPDNRVLGLMRHRRIEVAAIAAAIAACSSEIAAVAIGVKAYDSGLPPPPGCPRSGERMRLHARLQAWHRRTGRSGARDPGWRSSPVPVQRILDDGDTDCVAADRGPDTAKGTGDPHPAVWEPRPARQVLPVVVGSRTSRNQSPTMLMDRVVKNIAHPGTPAIHHALRR